MFKDNLEFLKWTVANSGLFFISVIASGILTMFLSTLFKDKFIGYIFLMVFTFIMGSSMAPSIHMIEKIPNGVTMILEASLITSIVFFGMSLSSLIFKEVKLLGNILLVSLLSLIGVSIFSLFYPSSILNQIIAYAGSVIFSLFILVDTRNMLDDYEESPILPVINLYLDVLNLFSFILNIVSINKD